MVAIFVLILAVIVGLCIVATVIWAINNIKIPAPFEWVKGILILLVVLCACALLWATFVGPTLGGHINSSSRRGCSIVHQCLFSRG
jgi:hypothetical protein